MTNQEAAKMICNDIKLHHDDPSGQYLKALNMAIDALLKEQEAVEPNEWIKCSDEMPEERDSIFAKLKGTDKWSSAMFEKMSEDVRVVVVFEDGTRRVHHSYTVDGKWDVEKKPPKRTVTHWMPNPKLPNEGK